MKQDTFDTAFVKAVDQFCKIESERTNPSAEVRFILDALDRNWNHSCNQEADEIGNRRYHWHGDKSRFLEHYRENPSSGGDYLENDFNAKFSTHRNVVRTDRNVVPDERQLVIRQRTATYSERYAGYAIWRSFRSSACCTIYPLPTTGGEVCATRIRTSRRAGRQRQIARRIEKTTQNERCTLPQRRTR
jgi:hypothetical protein